MDELLKIESELGTVFKKYLSEHGIKGSWVCEKLNFSAAHLSQMLNLKRTFSEVTRKSLNELLGTSFGDPVSAEQAAAN